MANLVYNMYMHMIQNSQKYRQVWTNLCLASGFRRCYKHEPQVWFLWDKLSLMAGYTHIVATITFYPTMTELLVSIAKSRLGVLAYLP